MITVDVAYQASVFFNRYAFLEASTSAWQEVLRTAQLDPWGLLRLASHSGDMFHAETAIMNFKQTDITGRHLLAKIFTLQSEWQLAFLHSILGAPTRHGNNSFRSLKILQVAGLWERLEAMLHSSNAGRMMTDENDSDRPGPSRVPALDDVRRVPPHDRDRSFDEQSA